MFNKIIIFLRTLFLYFLASFVVLFVGVPLLLLLLIMPAHVCYDNSFLFSLFDLLYKGIIGCLILPVRVKGKKNISCDPAIFVANHQSALDIPLLGSVLDGYPHIWYALAYYSRLPIIGLFIRRIGVPIDRDNLTSAARSLINGIKLFQGQKRHIMIFPEGGRFNDGKVHDFLRGFAIIARKTGRPVVPVFMPYNGLVYPPGSFLVYKHELLVIIGSKFLYQEDDTDESFTQRVYAWFKEQNNAVND